jgi:hypothetical protein
MAREAATPRKATKAARKAGKVSKAKPARKSARSKASKKLSPGKTKIAQAARRTRLRRAPVKRRQQGKARA